MSYTTAEAREGLLESIALAIGELETALAILVEAYDHLDERTADRLEDDLFRPVQSALARAKTTYAGFADRHGLTPRALPGGTAGQVTQGTASFVHGAVEAVQEADLLIAELQDSMAPVEVGDAELRAGLAAVREIAGAVEPAARGFLRDLGR